jgi:hypothetical protein
MSSLPVGEANCSLLVAIWSRVEDTVKIPKVPVDYFRGCQLKFKFKLIRTKKVFRRSGNVNCACKLI